MNLIKSLALASAVAFAPALALAQAPAPSAPGATAPAASNPAPVAAKGERKGHKRGERGERFKKADSNGDGALSKAEVDAAGMKRLSSNFDKIDANKDGKITKEEMKAAHGTRKGEHKGRREKAAGAVTPAAPAGPATK